MFCNHTVFTELSAQHIALIINDMITFFFFRSRLPLRTHLHTTNCRTSPGTQSEVLPQHRQARITPSDQP